MAVVRVPEDGNDLTTTDDPDELIAGCLWVARVLHDVAGLQPASLPRSGRSSSRSSSVEALGGEDQRNPGVSAKEPERPIQIAPTLA